MWVFDLHPRHTSYTLQPCRARDTEQDMLRAQTRDRRYLRQQQRRSGAGGAGRALAPPRAAEAQSIFRRRLVIAVLRRAAAAEGDLCATTPERPCVTTTKSITALKHTARRRPRAHKVSSLLRRPHRTASCQTHWTGRTPQAGVAAMLCTLGRPRMHRGLWMMHRNRGVQGLAVLDLVRWGFGGLVMVGNARLPDSKLHSPRSSGALPSMAACY